MATAGRLLTLKEVARYLHTTVEAVRRRMDEDESFPLPARIYLLNPHRARLTSGPGHAYRWLARDVAQYVGPH